MTATIGQLISQRKNELTKPRSTNLCQITTADKTWLSKWKNHSDIEKVFAPVNWGYTLSNPDKAYTAECPTLLHYDRVYGEGNAVNWIHAQVLALFGSSNCKDIEIAKGIRLFAESFAYEVKGYKLSELMLFFARYKAGKYDNSYSLFDAKRIGNAFFFQFVKERNMELDRINREAQRENLARNRFIPPQGYTSWSWYQELKKRADNGDSEAASMLNY